MKENVTVNSYSIDANIQAMPDYTYYHDVSHLNRIEGTCIWSNTWITHVPECIVVFHV